MKNRIKNIIIYALVLSFVLVVALSGASYAETPPYSGDYQKLSVRVNGKAVSDVAYTIKGNVYIKTSTLQKYGDTTKLTIDIAITDGAKFDEQFLAENPDLAPRED